MHKVTVHSAGAPRGMDGCLHPNIPIAYLVKISFSKVVLKTHVLVSVRVSCPWQSTGSPLNEYKVKSIMSQELSLKDEG